MSESEPEEPFMITKNGNNKRPWTQMQPNGERLQEGFVQYQDWPQQGWCQQKPNEDIPEKKKRLEMPNDTTQVLPKNQDINEMESRYVGIIPAGGYLEGEELAREWEINKKLREEAMEDMRRHCQSTPYVGQFLELFRNALNPTAFKSEELRIAIACLPHPCPLIYTRKRDGKIMVYRGHMRRYDDRMMINGRWAVDPITLE